MPVNLPPSFQRDGFVSAELARGKGRRLMIGCDGPADTGKSEFALSAPDPGVFICLDRGIDGVLDNQSPPPTRRERWAYKVINSPKATGATQAEALEVWKSFKEVVYKACQNPDVRTVTLDGDSDSWEVQRLAELGRLDKVPSIMYTSVNAARRAFYARLWDAQKIIIATNKIKKHYADQIDRSGNPVIGNDGKVVRTWDGTWERQGFEDQDYLWNIQLRHLYRPAGENAVTKKWQEQAWGIRITKCKVNMSLVGTELWGSDCNFPTLVEVCYPHVPAKEWGL
jgi:hypothetical protein